MPCAIDLIPSQTPENRFLTSFQTAFQLPENKSSPILMMLDTTLQAIWITPLMMSQVAVNTSWMACQIDGQYGLIQSRKPLIVCQMFCTIGCTREMISPANCPMAWAACTAN